MEETKRLPDPTAAAMSIWLKSLSRQHVHQEGWVAVNQRFHGITLGTRPFITKHYATPELREAAFDGLTLALMAIAHFEDVETLSKLLNSTRADAPKQH